MSTANDTTAKVAVITRTKDRPVLLRRAIESVLGQTFDDLQLCIVNDGGDRDAVEQVVHEFAAKAAGRIVLVHNETSSGREAAINVGVRASDSELIVLLDDDDTWDPEFLASTVSVLDDPAVMGVSTRSAVVYEKVSGTLIETQSAEILAAEIEQITLTEILSRNTIPTNSFVYRRSVFDELGGYDGSLPVLADWDFNIRFLVKYPVHFIDGKALAFWHQRRESDGDLGNSVVTSRDHETYRLRIRDRYLREALDHNQLLGALTYVADLVEERERRANKASDDTHDLLHAAAADLGHLRVMADGNREHLQILADGNREHLNTIAARMDYLNDLQTRRMTAQLDELNCRLKRIEGFVSLQIPKANLKGLARRSIAKFRRG